MAERKKSFGRSRRQRIYEAIAGLRAAFDQSSLDDLMLALNKYLTNQEYSQLLTCPGKVRFRQLVGCIQSQFNPEKMIEILKKECPSIICDLPDKLLEDITQICDDCNNELKEYNLDPESIFFGRQDELRRLNSIMTDTAVKVVNVCGMTGIGKSHLVRNFGFTQSSTGTKIVCYVNARNKTVISDLIAEILKKFGRDITSQEVPEDVLIDVIHGCQEPVILILDDLSYLMTDTGGVKNTLLFIDNFVQKTSTEKPVAGSNKKRKLAKCTTVKVIMTSQQKITYSDESFVHNELLGIKRRMRSYTEDIELSSFSDLNAKEFLDHYLPDWHKKEIDYAVRLSAGHPLMLNLLRICATDGLPYTEYLTLDDGHSNGMYTSMLSHQFQKLLRHQQKLLLSLSLFESGATVEFVHHIVIKDIGKDTSLSEFYNHLRKEFGSAFWITLNRSHDIYSNDIREDDDSVKNTIVSIYHPVIDKFLKGMLDVSEHKSRVMEQMVEFYTDLLAKVGETCLTDHGLSRATLVKHKSSILTAFRLMEMIREPRKLFSGVVSNDKEDINSSVHQLVCLHFYQDDLIKSFLTTLPKLYNNPLIDKGMETFLYIVHLLLLTAQSHWQELQAMIAKFSWSDMKYLRAGLHKFCEGIYFYSKAMVYTYAPVYSSSDEKRAEAEKLFAKAEDNIARLSNDLVPTTVKYYFLIHIYLNRAELVYKSGTQSRQHIEKASQICSKAVRYADENVPVLIPLVYGKSALYKSCLRDREADFPFHEVVKFFELSEHLFKRSLEEYKHRGMHEYNEAAEILYSYALLLRNHAVFLDATDKYRYLGEVLRLYTSSVKKLKECASYLTNRINQHFRFKSLYLVADTLETLQEATPRDQMHKRVKYQTEALYYYGKAYDLLKSDYRRCQIGADDWALEALTARLPELLARHGKRPESIDKVKENLKAVRRACGRDADNASPLSGSDQGESYSSDELEGLCNQATSISVTNSDTSSEPAYARMEFQEPDSSTDIPSTKKRKLDDC